MADEIKFTDDELKSLQELQNNYQEMCETISHHKLINKDLPS